MATKIIKDDVIRVRVTKEHKEKLKEIAKDKNVTISEIISVATENEIKKYEEKEKNYKKGTRHFGFLRINTATLLCRLRVIYTPY